MISRMMVRWRWLRRKLSRTYLTARLLGIRTPAGEASEPGLVLIQIDGLSRRQFAQASATGKLPYLTQLVRRGHFSVEDFYSGLPSTTPAVQAEIFFGVVTAVPSFEFLQRRSGRIFRMYEASSAAEVERELAARCPEPLLQGGHGYSNIYRAGAAQSRYCSQDLAPDEMLRRLHPLKSLVLSLIYAPKILRMAGLALLELGLAVMDAAKGCYDRHNMRKEFGFIPARILVSIVLREMIRLRMLLDIERGVQLIHANFLGYDEQAHRRGPDSAFAHWTLRGIDRTIGEICRAANNSSYRDYEWIVYSDHGQEHVTSFVVRHGRTLETALREVFGKGPLAGTELWVSNLPELLGNKFVRWRDLLAGKAAGYGQATVYDPEKQIVVTAMGPVGHLYLPRQLADEDMTFYAQELVQRAGIPLAAFVANDGMLRAFNRHGAWRLPADRAAVLGADHPYLDEVTADLVGLCKHPDSGDLVISGWQPEHPSLTFPRENGAHGGPGPEETRGFLLLPDRIRRWHVAHLVNTGQRVRGKDLREIVRHFLARDGVREERVAHYPARRRELPLRVMTYNIHSCIGTDGKVRPERVARVINHCDPDIVAVQEVDAHRERSGRFHQARVIADHLRMNHVFHAVFEEETESYGIAIFSKFPFEIRRAAHLTRASRRGLREARGAIWVQVECDGLPPFHFINTHFGLGRDERHRQTEEILGPNWLGAITSDEPVILCGDFNSGPRSQVFKRLHGGRLRDAQLSLPGHRARPTFSSFKPLLRIDHVFVSDHFDVRAADLADTPTAVRASDHLPLCIELTIPSLP